MAYSGNMKVLVNCTGETIRLYGLTHRGSGGRWDIPPSEYVAVVRYNQPFSFGQITEKLDNKEYFTALVETRPHVVGVVGLPDTLPEGVVGAIVTLEVAVAAYRIKFNKYQLLYPAAPRYSKGRNTNTNTRIIGYQTLGRYEEIDKE